MGKRALAVAAAAAVVAVSVVAAEATSVRRMSAAEAARRASTILVGTVSGESCRLATTPGGKTRIFTDYDLRDLSVWKGTLETSNRVVSVVGGRLHGRVLKVAGAPRLETGRRYLLFVGDAEPLCPFVGWGQGVFPLEEGPGGALLVHRQDGEPVSLAAGGEIATGGPAMRLDAFLAALAREGVRAPPPPASAPDAGGGAEGGEERR